MSQRVEWMDEAFLGCQVVAKGTVVGEHEVTGQVGVVLSADSTTVIEGDADRVLLMLGILADQITAYKEAGFPAVG